MNTIDAAVEGKSKYARDAWLRALARTADLAERGDILPQVIERLAAEFGSRPALMDPNAAFDFRELAARVNQYARFARAQRLGAGDCVALYMNNCVEYLAIWLGLTRAGATVALLNSQLQGEVLAHSINIANPKLLISGADLAERLAMIRARLAPGLIEFSFGATDAAQALDAAVAQLSSEALGAEFPVPPIDAIALYIYTSGTTGMPKAAKVSHYRLMQWSHWFAGMMDTTAEDRMFNALPLYHSVGGVVATFAPLVSGGSVVIRPRFSASDFWRDIAAERCTLFQYIGELCRYLVNSAPQAAERGHRLRLACGNGLRPEVWGEFQARFRIPRILEYYASTEGNFSLYNCEGQVGAIGRIPKFVAARLPVALLRFDVDAGVPLRNAEGLCEPCATGEVGEAVGRIPRDAERGGRFEGYADPEASERKILRDVFESGDAWYRTGDLMRQDARGFYYFVDRIGETYRWKGENVSCAEVLSVLAGIPGVQDGVVYGVQVPGYDGRAGMAALVVNEKFDRASFRAATTAALPAYARPVFLRLIAALETTATFKPRKQDLLAAGFDPERIKDPLYCDDARAGAYVPLDAALFRSIGSGALRL